MEIKSLASIIIPHYELHDLLKVICLSNLYFFTPRDATFLAHDIIIVDNGSKEPIKFSQYEHPFNVVRSDKRLSFAEVCNKGAEKATGDVLIFLNNDTQILPGWLAPILKTLRGEEIGVCGAKLLSTDMTIQHVGVEFGKYRVPYHVHLGEEDKDFSGVREVPAVTAACLAIKKDLFVKLGGFSEDFPVGNYEDVDLCLRVKDKGYKVVCNLDSRIIHIGGASYRIHPEEHSEEAIKRNWDILNNKWKHKEDSFFDITDKSPVLPRETSWGLNKGDEGE